MLDNEKFFPFSSLASLVNIPNPYRIVLYLLIIVDAEVLVNTLSNALIIGRGYGYA